jgi:peptidoglycan/LPS O-acetylase OafA/YrhL
LVLVADQHCNSLDTGTHFQETESLRLFQTILFVTTHHQRQQQHLPQLDGLRGIAIAIVVLGHMLVFAVGFGSTKLGPLPPLGVTLFFVLSGFLITRILLDARSKAEYYLSFYARRALRIWPLYFLVLAILFLFTNHRVAALTFDETRVRWPFFVFYVQNIVYKNATLFGPPALGITWSLAVEEQFYTTWPLIVRNLSNITLKRLLVIFIVAAPIARFLCPQFGIDPYINPLCRFDGMAMGGLVAIWITERRPVRKIVMRVARSVAAIAIVLGCAFYVTSLTHLFSKTIESALWTSILLTAMGSTFAIRVLSHAALRFLGKISYCAYLTHFIIASFVVSLWPGAGIGIRVFRVAVVLTMTCLIGMLSWRFLEEPILRLKQYFPAGEPQARDRSESSASVALTNSERTEGTA